MPDKKNGTKSRTFKLSEKEKLALDLKKKELKLQMLKNRSKRDLEIYYDDTEDIKKEEQKKDQIDKKIKELNTVRMVSEQSALDFSEIKEEKKKKMM